MNLLEKIVLFKMKTGKSYKAIAEEANISYDSLRKFLLQRKEEN